MNTFLFPYLLGPLNAKRFALLLLSSLPFLYYYHFLAISPNSLYSACLLLRTLPLCIGRLLPFCCGFSVAIALVFIVFMLIGHIYMQLLTYLHTDIHVSMYVYIKICKKINTYRSWVHLLSYKCMYVCVLRTR